MIKVDSTYVLDVEINGVVYKIREPSVKEVKEFSEKSDDKESIDKVLSFLSNLGLPMDVSLGLGMSQLKVIIDSLTGALSEKK